MGFEAVLQYFDVGWTTGRASNP